MEKVEIIDKRVEGNWVIYTAHYYPDENNSKEHIKFENRVAHDFLVSEEGRYDVMNKLLEAGKSWWNRNQIAMDKTGAFDIPEEFTKADTVKPIVEAPKTDEQIFQEAVMALEQKKRYLDLGLITKEEYDTELSKVKALMPKAETAR